jgi:Flp pilus assembly protein TadB
MLQSFPLLIPGAIFAAIILSLYCVYYSRARRVQARISDQLDAQLRAMETQLKALDRQSDAMERIAAALEFFKDRPTATQ